MMATPVSILELPEVPTTESIKIVQEAISPTVTPMGMATASPPIKVIATMTTALNPGATKYATTRTMTVMAALTKMTPAMH